MRDRWPHRLRVARVAAFENGGKMRPIAIFIRFNYLYNILISGENSTNFNLNIYLIVAVTSFTVHSLFFISHKSWNPAIRIASLLLSFIPFLSFLFSPCPLLPFRPVTSNLVISSEPIFHCQAQIYHENKKANLNDSYFRTFRVSNT